METFFCIYVNIFKKNFSIYKLVYASMKEKLIVGIWREDSDIWCHNDISTIAREYLIRYAASTTNLFLISKLYLQLARPPL